MAMLNNQRVIRVSTVDRDDNPANKIKEHHMIA